jgi:DNA repair exonuclease SbcCD nuclease subunit
MKVLFTADLHIKLGQKNIPKAWALRQYEIMFNELNRIFEEQRCDIEIHGGDIFDKVPTMEELALYMEYLWRDPSRGRYIFDGNHEATKKGDTFLKYLNPMLPTGTALFYGSCSFPPFDIIPYTDLKDLKNIKAENKICLTHVRGAIPPHVKPEVNLDLFKKWDIVFAGDLHAHSNSQKNIVYPGSPRTVTFHRNEVELGVIVFDTDEPKNWKWHKIDVPQLIRKTIYTPEEMIETDFHHTIYELKGNMRDLAKINKDHKLLDKKIIHNEEPPSLDLVNMTIEEELEKYLSEILKFPKPEIKEVMGVFHANT